MRAAVASYRRYAWFSVPSLSHPTPVPFGHSPPLRGEGKKYTSPVAKVGELAYRVGWVLQPARNSLFIPFDSLGSKGR